MPLTDTAVRQTKPGIKPTKLSDERGLFLLVQPNGNKLWRLKYRFEGKERKLAFGAYPDISLREARMKRDEARTLLANGTDPGAERRRMAEAKKIESENTFGAVADEFLDKISDEGRAAVTIGKSRWLVDLLNRELRDRPVATMTPNDVLAALRKVEAKGHRETARRMRSMASRVFRYAMATSRCDRDPTWALRGALKTPVVKHHSAILEPDAVGQLMRAIDGFAGQPFTQIALRLSPHVFVRPGELRRAEWDEVDFGKALWTIPASKMKMRQPHLVPLSRQALELFQSAWNLDGSRRYIFSSMYPGSRPMSENTINAALRRLGYSGDEMTAHGFRAMASTLLNESGLWHPDAIERALAHSDTNVIRGFYNRGTYWDERVRMAQWWSDHLDELRASASAQPAMAD